MPPTSSTKRLLREATELTTHPSPYFHATPISESNLYDWHFTIQGPPSPSPYANGLYHGRIVLPPTYPLRPPSFRFLTPSGRFEVNREICLSISGHHEETWQPAWGIRTALIALRSFMDGDAKGQVGGLDVGVEVRRRYAVESRDWCCDACEWCMGRRNEVVMREWRGFCAERGVLVEEEGGKSENEASVRVTEGDAMEREMGSGDANADISTPTPTSTTAPAPAPAPAHMSASTDEATATSASPQTQTQPQEQSQLQTQPLTPTPTTTTTPQQPHPQPQFHPQQHPLPTATPPSQETPWLDRAIIGVVIALAVMILRRLAREDME
ncbi:ubiquitin-conjugating enzyme E2 [Aspergillus ibericus CBS 121593]|uniref:UBC-like protein n=1 Tax=Aspergillus ibericus CBS 121593 TaxID=1448316 RepID=A0A395HB56_9EURO|nr:UBC-like protein [Aspergillus ibericus CBS 121593]RAL04799.1 UBC-like protein [Aspergillus ibericus CBS 121593]